MANDDEADQEQDSPVAVPQTGGKEQSKMSSDGEDFDYEDDTGFGDDVDMGGESSSFGGVIHVGHQGFCHFCVVLIPFRSVRYVRAR